MQTSHSILSIYYSPCTSNLLKHRFSLLILLWVQSTSFIRLLDSFICNLVCLNASTNSTAIPQLLVSLYLVLRPKYYELIIPILEDPAKGSIQQTFPCCAKNHHTRIVKVLISVWGINELKYETNIKPQCHLMMANCC